MGLIHRVDEITPDVFGDYGLMKNCDPVKIKLKRWCSTIQPD
jgi:hypothetical protein